MGNSALLATMSIQLSSARNNIAFTLVLNVCGSIGDSLLMVLAYHIMNKKKLQVSFKNRTYVVRLAGVWFYNKSTQSKQPINTLTYKDIG